jgi:flavin reductase (DIM6/NTAB) family NADH-FMN oxidoreductase RutF
MGLVNLNPPNVAVNIAEDIRSSDIVTAVSATSTSSLALPANASRLSYSIYNAGNATVYIRENATVTAALYKHPIPPGFLFESDSFSRYTGPIAVITASNTTSNLMVAESTTPS